ncbi:hypothetical protein [Bdellovibrio reynosensis]|uniref:DUF3015 domain-containing protein n=1 Tax=Bdellovibrio reynosensis TaxID=2835041 RepID=A0ABY4C8X8_9BACT|nr:hypothetical protein [Bdellovibrio reynosensis]UOE99937.1 hypothetical protein MNR06_09525 [Bdellovibrio reynosensis]
MKPILKKIVPAILLTSSIAIAAIVITKEEVNRKIAGIVAPFNGGNTVMQLFFTELNLDDQKTIDMGISGILTKDGPDNNLILNLQNAAYHYGDGSAPWFTGDLFLKLNLVKTFGQNTLNLYANELEKIANEMAAEYGKKYGDAITFDIAMDDVKKDVNDNVIMARMHLNARIDFSKLPASLDPKEVEFTSIRTQLSAAQTGLAGKILVGLNPLYKGFHSGESGLKNYLEKLLNDDPEIHQELISTVDMLNSIGDYLVNHKAEEQPNEPPPSTPEN